MQATRLSFTISPITHERIFVGLDAETLILGQHFSTGVTMTTHDWNALKDSAEIMAENVLECVRPLDAQSQYMADAYLAAVLMTPRYREDGKTFDADLFLPNSKLFSEATHAAIQNMDDPSWQLATKMQAAMLGVKQWGASANAEKPPASERQR